MNAQLDSPKASMQAQAKPAVVNPPSLAFREEVKESSCKPADAPVGRGQVRENAIAALTLTSTCQRMLIYHDQRRSSRLPGNMVIVHEDRCAIEFKILMHRPGRIIRIYQNALEILDGTTLKDMDKDVVIRVLEDPLPTSPSSPMGRYTINQSIIGNMMVHDPVIPFSSTNEGPRLLSFVVSEQQRSASRGGTLGEVWDLLRLDPKASLVGVCGCGRRYKNVREGAFIPYGATSLQWCNLRK